MTPDEIRTKKNGLFATYKTIEEVVDWVNNGGPPLVAVGIAVNTTLEILAQEIEHTEPLKCSVCNGKRHFETGNVCIWCKGTGVEP
jgi:hypothetical protein